MSDEEEYEPDVIFSRIFEPFTIQYFPLSQRWMVINCHQEIWRKDNTWGVGKMIKFFDYDELVDFVYKTFKVSMHPEKEDSD